ncbi:winged helix-turn-helix domain-containing protein [Methanothrix sp.]|uniref:winged helix-turn-helix domain-containing protein n=1 Tax=Methanothrix sp. TaxID=90426 RepID=UPI003C75C8FB
MRWFAMRERRSKDQIVIEILHLCENGENITRIVYRTNTSFTIVKAYLHILMKNDLLECIEASPRLYKTTRKGLEMRDRLEGLHKLMEGLKV